MKLSVNKALLSIPLYQLTFITPFPKEELYYNYIVKSISDIKQNHETLLIIDTKNEWEQFNNEKTAHQLIQNSDLSAIVISKKANNQLKEDVLSLYLECQIPIIHVADDKTIVYFEREFTNVFSYSNLSVELDGFYKRGFMNIATNLSLAFNTPFIILDENEKLLQHTGTEKELDTFFQWFNEHKSNNKKSQQNLFEQYLITSSGHKQLRLFASTHLVAWQKSMIDKFIGFTAVLFQTEEVVQKQNEAFKEFFIYELLCRKFESKTSLIKQGKTWGLNLEKPHHLLLLDIETSSGELVDDSTLLDEMILHLESQISKKTENLIILPFQKHIVVLIEDEKGDVLNNNTSLNIANWIEAEISKSFPNYSPHIGIGKWYVDTIDLDKSFDEAKIAIQFGKVWFENNRVYYMHDLGVLHLLFSVEGDLLQTFCEENLTHLINSDQKQGTEYLKTLKVYFQYNGIINDVAEVLFIHPNTLRMRLNKIEQIMGIDRQNLEHLLTLMVAVKIYYSFYVTIG